MKYSNKDADEVVNDLLNDSNDLLGEIPDIDGISYSDELVLSPVFYEDDQEEIIQSFTKENSSVLVEEQFDFEDCFHEAERSGPNEEASLDESEPKEQKPKENMEYLVTQQIIKKHGLVSCDGSIYLYDEKLGFYNELTEPDLHVFIRSNVSNAIDKKLNKYKLIEIAYRLLSQPELQFHRNQFDRFNYLINFKNVVYDTRSNKFLEHSSDYFFTHYVNVEISTIRVLEPVNVIHSSYYAFDTFLDDCTQGDDLKRYSLQEMFGYIISNYVNAKKFFILLGQAHTGKSVILELLKNIVGEKYTTAVTLKQLGTNRFMTAELSKSRLNITPEMNESGKFKGTEIIKALTGNDTISAEFKGKNPFSFKSKAKLVVAGNHMPELEKPDTTSALTDRMMFILFNHSVPVDKRDPNLVVRLLEEKEHIIQWALGGLNRLISNKFIFTESEDASMFKAQYVAEMSITDFISDCCEVNISNEKWKTHKRDLYAAYFQYCKDNRQKNLSEKDFFNEIRKMGAKLSKFRINGSSPLQGFLGIKLKEKEYMNFMSTLSTEN